MPDPLTSASAFATLIGLLCNYRQEQGAREALNHQKFVEWLEYHRHEEIKNLICSTATLRGEVDQLLRADHDLILEKLDAVNTALASLMSQVVEFRGLSMTMLPEAELSDQAVMVLRQLVKSDSQYIIYMTWDAGCVLQLNQGGHIDFTEPRFLGDDLDKLASLGLLKPEYGSGDAIMYHVTRNAVRLIGAIDKTTTQ
jgi:hypothetical protein